MCGNTHGRPPAISRETPSSGVRSVTLLQFSGLIDAEGTFMPVFWTPCGATRKPRLGEPGPCGVPGARGLPADPSEGDAVRAEVGDGVEVRAVVGTRAGLEVQVRAGDVAGRAGEADLLARGDLLAGRDIDRRQVAVLGVGAVVHLDDDLVAVRAAPAGLDDRAGADGLDGRAVRGVEVDTGVAAGGPDGAAGLVAGGHVGARDRRDEGVETLTLGLAGCALLLGADLLCLLGGLLARGLLGRLAGLGLGGL